MRVEGLGPVAAARHVVVAILLVAASGPVDATVRTAATRQTRIVPRDDTATDPAFATFKARLLAAARSGDIPALRDMMAPTVMVNGDEGTPAGALSDVSPGQPWRALRDALELGVYRLENAFIAPFAGPLLESLDDAVVVRRNVRLRAAPSTDARVRRVLSMWEVVTLDRSHRYDAEFVERSDSPTGPTAWARVRTAEGDAGYVYGKLLVSPDNTSFGFRRVDGEWKLSSISVGE